MASIIQSVIFDKSIWSIIDSANWLLNNDYKVKKIDETKHFYRYRQISPITLKKKGYTEYHNKKIGHGIELVIAYKKEHKYDTII